MKTVWSYNKNFEYIGPPEQSDKSDAEDSPDAEEFEEDDEPKNDHFLTFTYDMLFKWILNYCNEDA